MSIEKFIERYSNITEEYRFYNDEITLRYDKKNHVYLLATTDGLEPQEGVSTICKIIDKSKPLMNWAVKVMAQKILDNIPKDEYNPFIIRSIDLSEFEKLVLEAKKAKDEHLDDAGSVGNVAHAWIENYIKASLSGETFLLDLPAEDRAKSCCVAMLGWSRNHNVRFLITERKIYSRKYKYAGTMDGLALVDSCSDPKCCPVHFRDILSVVDWKTSNNLYLEYILQVLAYKNAHEEEFGEVIPHCWIIRLGKEDGAFEPWHLHGNVLDLGFNAFKDALSLTRSIALVEKWLKDRNNEEKAVLKAEKKAAREVKDALETEAKAQARELKAQARMEALAKACKASGKYKGTKRSSCTTGPDGGNCLECTLIWASKHPGHDSNSNRYDSELED